MRFKSEVFSNGEFRKPILGISIWDSGKPNPNYAPDSLVGAVERFFADAGSVGVDSIRIKLYGVEYRYTRLPNVTVVYEVRPLHPVSFLPLTDWVVVPEQEFLILSDADYFETRKREVES